MGRSITPKYVAKLDGLGEVLWRGQATKKRLQEYVENMNASFTPGGSNAHLKDQKPVVHARIYLNASPYTVVAEI